MSSVRSLNAFLTRKTANSAAMISQRGCTSRGIKTLEMEGGKNVQPNFMSESTCQIENNKAVNLCRSCPAATTGACQQRRHTFPARPPQPAGMAVESLHGPYHCKLSRVSNHNKTPILSRESSSSLALCSSSSLSTRLKTARAICMCCLDSTVGF